MHHRRFKELVARNACKQEYRQATWSKAHRTEFEPAPKRNWIVPRLAPLNDLNLALVGFVIDNYKTFDIYPFW